MKKMISFVLIAGVLFGISASVSYFLMASKTAEEQPKNKSDEAAATAIDADGPSGDGGTSQPDTVPSPVRAKYNPDAEVAAQLVGSLRNRETAVKQRESMLINRENNLQLVFKDVRDERSTIDDLRKQVSAEAKALDAQMTSVTKAHSKLEEQKAQVEERVKELEKRLIELEGVEQGNLKKLAATYGMMDPEKAAKILQDMADNGKEDTVVKILGFMQQRQAAKIFAELPQRLAGELMEKLKGFKPAKPKENK